MLITRKPFNLQALFKLNDPKVFGPQACMQSFDLLFYVLTIVLKISPDRSVEPVGSGTRGVAGSSRLLDQICIQNQPVF